MNQKAVLMCLNIPKFVRDDYLYELFCSAGPIDDIYFGKSGKSVFIIYEFAEAVSTAKEIFKDVKLLGKPLRMFDKNDIEDIYSRQEEELNLKRKHDSENESPSKRRCNVYSSPYNNHQAFHSSEGSSYQEKFSRELNSYSTDYSTFDARRQTNPYQSIPNNNYHHRTDLMPSSQRNYKDNSSFTSSRRDRDMFCNPYANEYGGGGSGAVDNLHEDEFRHDGSVPTASHEQSVSQYRSRERFQHFEDSKSQRYEDSRDKKYNKPYDRRDHRNDYKSRSTSYEHSSRNQHRNQKHQNYSYKSRRY